MRLKKQVEIMHVRIETERDLEPDNQNDTVGKREMNWLTLKSKEKRRKIKAFRKGTQKNDHLKKKKGR